MHKISVQEVTAFYILKKNTSAWAISIHSQGDCNFLIVMTNSLEINFFFKLSAYYDIK